MYNKLLQRQLQKHLSDDVNNHEFSSFLKVVNESYNYYEKDRLFLERAIELTSDEMIQLNENLKKETEEAKKAHALLQTLFNNINEVFFSISFPDLKLLQISPACERVYGYSQESFLNYSNLFELVLDEDKEIVQKKNQLMQEGKSFTQEYRINHKDGSIRWLETKITPTLEKGKNLIRIDGITADITKRKSVEEEKNKLMEDLKKNEKRFSSLFQKARDPILLLDENQLFIDCNEAAIKILGAQSKEQILNKLPEDFSPEYQADEQLSSGKSKQMVKNAFIKGSTQFEWLYKSLDGTVFPVEVSLSRIPMENIDILLVHWRDITERKLAEEKILEANENLKIINERLNEAQEIAQIGSWSYDLMTGESVRSPEFYKIFESSHSKIFSTPEGYFNYFIPDDQSFQIDKFQNALQDHQPYKSEGRIKLPSGKIKFIQSNAKCLVNESDELIKMYGTVQDITELKNIEEEFKKTIAELKKRNLELDKFVYSVSHDLRAPLSSMLGVVEIAEEDATDELMLINLRLLKENIKKLDGFITDILDYSRNARMEITSETINFKNLTNDVVKNLKYMGNNRKIDIQIDVIENTPFKSDKISLYIILNNLVSNAIRYQNLEAETPFVHVNIATSDKETAIIVKDNGIGIRKELQPKIFDMFYRVSEASVGSGLGLYIVKEIVQKLNGKIEVESELGRGSIFKVKFPIN